MHLDKWRRGTLKLILVLPIAFYCIFYMILHSDVFLIILILVILITYSILVRVIVDKIFI